MNRYDLRRDLEIAYRLPEKVGLIYTGKDVVIAGIDAQSMEERGLVMDWFDAAREGWPEAIQQAIAAKARVKELERELASAEQGAEWVNEKIKDLEVQCAAMREVLLKINELGNCDKCGQTYVLHDIAEIKHQALSKDIGKALLERMAKLEAVAEAARKHISAGCYVLPELITALAELEGDKNE